MARSVFPLGPEADKGGERPLEQKPAIERRKPLIKGGATSDKYILAATQGGADRTYQEISLDQIQDSRIKDRLDVDEDIEEMMASLKEKGQQIPIIVRILTDGDKPYEVVVGRRRIAASRRLGWRHINAFVTKMSERDAFITQGIENSARLETSFIERARTAALALQEGFDKQDAAHALNISSTLISFMIRIYEAVGEDVVRMVGPARGVGRRKWEQLAKAAEDRRLSQNALLDLIDGSIESSVERFSSLLAKVETGKRVRTPSPAPQQSAVEQSLLDGRVQTRRNPNQLVVKLSRKAAPELLDKIEKGVEAIIKTHEEDAERGS